MHLPRLHLFELEDFPWFPKTIRDLATDYLYFAEKRLGLHRPVVALIADPLRESDSSQIVDLCSGGGGPVAELLRVLATRGIKPQATLTDRFPNIRAFQRIAAQSNGNISFRNGPVDARKVPPELRGFRTIFNSFHHFRPQDAIAVLRDAVEAGQPIGIFEIPDRTWRTVVPMLLLTPFLVGIATPFIRPFRWQRLLWTYLLPLVPLTCWWDGVVSQLRAYSPAELLHLAKAAGTAEYDWRAGRVPIVSTPGRLTYLIGFEKHSKSRRSG